eukprot:scaffold1040_cov165-Amphora_coffeaeformis.AAC.5
MASHTATAARRKYMVIQLPMVDKTLHERAILSNTRPTVADPGRTRSTAPYTAGLHTPAHTAPNNVEMANRC